jgi:hypothetical protein
VKYSNDEFVEFTEYAELWKVTAVDQPGEQYFERSR